MSDLEALVTAARLTLSATLMLAGILKMTGPTPTAMFRNVLRLPKTYHWGLHVLIIIAELAVGTSLVLPTTFVIGSWACLFLLGLYSLVAWWAIHLRVAVQCNCFGAERGMPLGIATIFRNILLAALAAGILLFPASVPVTPTFTVAVGAALLGVLVFLPSSMLARALEWKRRRLQHLENVAMQALET